MTERTITTTIEWGVEYRWPDGYTQIVWYDGDRQCAEGDIRMHGVNGPRIETARLVTRRVPSMLAVAVLLAIGCGLAGLDASYQLSTASGATIAATILVVYLLALGRATLRRRSVPPAGPGGPAVR